MKTVLTLVSALLVAQHAAAQCNNLKTFSTTFVPACDPNDVYIKWPNYDNQYTYYYCNGVGNPKLMSCPSGQVFIYVLQQCGACSSYIPPVQCEQLKTQNPPNCVPSGTTGGPTASPGETPTGPTLPTPHYPSSAEPVTTTPKTTTPKATKATAAPTTANTGPPVGPTIPTPSVLPPGGSTLIPPPPSPSTNNPNVPMPPTPPPTPPSINVEPPTIQ